MKRIVFIAVSCLAVAVAALIQVNCQPAAPTNRPVAGTASNTNSEKPPIDVKAIEAELIRIEMDFPRVVREKDVEAIRRVEADDAILIYPDGNLGSKEQDLKDIGSGALSAESWENTDLVVKVLDADAAIASGRAIVTGGKARTPDGKTIDISGQYRFVDTFARRDGQWKLVASAAVPVREPPSATPSPSATRTGYLSTSPSPKPTN